MHIRVSIHSEMHRQIFVCSLRNIFHMVKHLVTRFCPSEVEQPH